MAELSGSVTVPGIIHLFGEYGSIFGEPTIAVAINHKLSLFAKPAEFEFFIIDGYKMNHVKHSYFNNAVQDYWIGKPLEFTTSSQIPWHSGFNTHAALAVALSSLLMRLRGKLDVDSDLKSDENAIKLATQAYALQNFIDGPISPISTSTALAGGTVLMLDAPIEPIWSIQGKKRSWYIHELDDLENVSIVIGYLKDSINPSGKTTTKFSIEHPKPLFDSPNIPTHSKQLHQPPRIRSSSSANKSQNTGPAESILKKVARLQSKSGFVKDIIKDIGKNARAGVQALGDGDLSKIGILMNEQQNLITILGVYPTELKALVKAAEQHSLGVTPTGFNGDAIVALTQKPELVVNSIIKAGGEAIITEISKQGLVLE